MAWLAQVDQATRQSVGARKPAIQNGRKPAEPQRNRGEDPEEEKPAASGKWSSDQTAGGRLGDVQQRGSTAAELPTRARSRNLYTRNNVPCQRICTGQR